jgi:hypothetical protein
MGREWVYMVDLWNDDRLVELCESGNVGILFTYDADGNIAVSNDRVNANYHGNENSIARRLVLQMVLTRMLFDLARS